MNSNLDPNKPSGLAITSLCFGIASIVICCFGINLVLGITAIVLAIIEKNNIKNHRASEAGTPYANWGLGLGIGGVVIFFGGTIIAIFVGAGTVFSGILLTIIGIVLGQTETNTP